MNKRLLSLVLALVMVFASFNFVAAEGFTDVAQGHWGHDQIQYLAEIKVVEGHGGDAKGTFTPGKDVTRAQFVTMVNNALEHTGEELTAGDVDFTDVATGSWYYGDVEKAVEAGYIKGHGGSGQGTFTPNNPVTREDAATMIGRAFELVESDELTSFTDADKISAYAEGFVNAAVLQGYIEGYPEGNFQPKRAINRAQAATIIARVLIELDEDVGSLIADIEDLEFEKWYVGFPQDVEDARDAYDQLNNYQKEAVTNYDDLEIAEARVNLNTLIGKALAPILIDKADYTEESWKALETSFNAAVETRDDMEASLEDLTEAQEDLQEKYDGLILVSQVDLAAAEAALVKAEETTTATRAEVNVAKERLDAAKALINALDPEDYNEGVVAALEARADKLQAYIDSLVFTNTELLAALANENLEVIRLNNGNYDVFSITNEQEILALGDNVLVNGKISVNANKVTIKGLTININADYAIELVSGFGDLTVSDNTIKATQEKALAIYINAAAGKNNTITNNTFEGKYSEAAVSVDVYKDADVVTKVEANDFEEVEGKHLHIWNNVKGKVITDIAEDDMSTDTYQ